jgi:hypothetical protein
MKTSRVKRNLRIKPPSTIHRATDLENWVRLIADAERLKRSTDDSTTAEGLGYSIQIFQRQMNEGVSFPGIGQRQAS